MYNIDISTKTIDELKVMAYDLYTEITIMNNNLQIINNQIEILKKNNTTITIAQ